MKWTLSTSPSSVVGTYCTVLLQAPVSFSASMSDAAFPITVAQIVALFMESIFYGTQAEIPNPFCLSLFSCMVYVQVYISSRSDIV